MELLHKYGYSLVFCVILLEQLGFPIPAAPILILSGALVAGKELSFFTVLLWATLGAFIGDLVWYFIGNRRGRQVLRLLCHLSLSPESCVRKTEDSFRKHGMNSLLFAKFVPGLNTIAPPMAGMFHTRFFAFFWRDLAGILVYVLAFTLPGMLFQKKVDITHYIDTIGRTFFWMLLAGLASYVAWKYIKLRILQRLLYKARITPDELHERIAAGEEFIIVDLRTSPSFNGTSQQIPGAIRIHPERIDEHIQLLSKDKWIVMYCT